MSLSSIEELELAKILVESEKNSKSFIDARNRLVLAYNSLVYKVASNMPYKYDDLIQNGQMGLLKAASTFDYRLGKTFIEYAASIIHYEMIDGYYAEKFIRIPNNCRSDFNKIVRFMQDYELKYHQEADELIISKGLGFNIKYVRLLLNLPTYIVYSKDDYFDIKDDKDNNIYLLLHKLSLLNQRELKIITEYYGLNGTKRMTFKQIGQALNISGEAVRKIHDNAILKMKRND